MPLPLLCLNPRQQHDFKITVRFLHKSVGIKNKNKGTCSEKSDPCSFDTEKGFFFQAKND